MREIIPTGPGEFDFVWTHFGFESDDEAMTRRRLRQANLFGPAGFVSADDGEVIEWSQEGFEQKPAHRTVVEMGGREESLELLQAAITDLDNIRLLCQQVEAAIP